MNNYLPNIFINNSLLELNIFIFLPSTKPKRVPNILEKLKTNLEQISQKIFKQ